MLKEFLAQVFAMHPLHKLLPVSLALFLIPGPAHAVGSEHLAHRSTRGLPVQLRSGESIEPYHPPTRFEVSTLYLIYRCVRRLIHVVACPDIWCRSRPSVVWTSSLQPSKRRSGIRYF